LEHGREGGLAPATPAISDRGGYPHDGGSDEPGQDGRERSFPTGEHEVDVRPMGFEPSHGTEKTVEARDADVVGGEDP
jgi:hypothetical protein